MNRDTLGVGGYISVSLRATDSFQKSLDGIFILSPHNA